MRVKIVYRDGSAVQPHVSEETFAAMDADFTARAGVKFYKAVQGETVQVPWDEVSSFGAATLRVKAPIKKPDDEWSKALEDEKPETNVWGGL